MNHKGLKGCQKKEEDAGTYDDGDISSEQSRNLLALGTKLLKMRIPQMNADFGSELSHSRIARANSSGTGRAVTVSLSPIHYRQTVGRY